MATARLTTFVTGVDEVTGTAVVGVEALLTVVVVAAGETVAMALLGVSVGAAVGATVGWGVGVLVGAGVGWGVWTVAVCRRAWSGRLLGVVAVVLVVVVLDTVAVALGVGG